jgi:tetratricopeptide (TPR) repeat protein
MLPTIGYHVVESVFGLSLPGVAHNNLANLLWDAGRHDEAIEHCQATLRIKPDLWEAYANFCIAFNLANRSGDAVATVQRAIELASSKGREATATQFEDWLTHYQTELRRSEEAAAQPPSPSTQ